MTGCSNSTFDLNPLTVVICLSASLCSYSCKSEEPMVDAGPMISDAGVSTDAGGIADAGPAPDAGPADAGPPDAGPLDAGAFDAGVDAGSPDAGVLDAGIDAGPVDAGPPGPPFGLNFATAAQDFANNTCSSVIEFDVVAADARVTSVTVATVVQVSALTGTASFFSDPNCTTGGDFVLIQPGNSRGQFYFQASAEGATTLQVESGGLAPDTETFTILP